ncbi:MAG: sigma-54 dependent transcriptional regulator [Verrucomicrobiales bacterium]|nr:sigma-54 dependent transcriptional regulator [Verrucomicrobiales bacterium]
MAKARILIVEDEVIVREDLRDLLEGLDYEVVAVAAAGHEAITTSNELRPDLVLMDIKLKGDLDGIEAARSIRAQSALPVVFLTAFADEGTIERAKAACPYGYLTKPFDDRAIRATIEVALHRHREENQPRVRAMEATAPDAAAGVPRHGLIGKSSPLRALCEQIARVARVNSTVLIEGETGTGKERVARAIHQASSRADKPFITVNCAGLTETLAATELFGHRRGAFTGAVADHKGVFEAADGGTVFLDEIGDIPRSQQPFLLRVLEEREVTRVGETSPRKIDVRVLVASNRSLDDEVAAGRFRSDLFYRIRVGRIAVPPLRERAGDVPLLAKAFLALFRNKGVAPLAVSDAALELLGAYPWPGNVRELKNSIEFAAIRCPGQTIQTSDLPPEIVAVAHGANGPPLSPEEEKARLREALEKADGNRSEAARLLGISRATFYRRLSQFGLGSAGD